MQGPRQPMQANEGHSAAIDDRYVCFLIYILFFIFYITTKPTKAHSSQRRPRQANASQRRPTAANEGQCKAHDSQRRPTNAISAAIDDRYVFFLIYILFFILYITTKHTKDNRS